MRRRSTSIGYSGGDRTVALQSGLVVPNGAVCVQCGVCSFSCPVGIDVRSYCWRDEPVSDSRCIRCSECIVRCPRSVLRMEHVPPHV